MTWLLLDPSNALADDTPSSALASPATPAAAPAPAPMSSPLDGLVTDLRDAFTGTNLLWYGGAIGATGVMAFAGADHAIRVGVQRDLYSPAVADGAFYTGYLLPAIVAPALYVTGLLAHDSNATGAGSAALQALGITVVTTGLLKIAAGRAYPLNGGDPRAPDRLDHPEYARIFRPFQTYWPLPSWPSGHAATTFCLAATLTAYYPKNLWIPIIGYSLALLVSFGMVDGDSHWASDVIGGGLIGHAIGYSVGSAFRRRAQGAKDRGGTGPTLVPVLWPTYGGVAGTFF